MRRSPLLLLCLPVAGVAATIAALVPAGSGANVAADTGFDGVVNNHTAAATVYVRCKIDATAGIIAPDQTWAVTPGALGHTGVLGGSIHARVGAANAVISDIDTPVAVPEVPAPCTGSDTATFTPVDAGTNVRATSVDVTYVAVAS